MVLMVEHNQRITKDHQGRRTDGRGGNLGSSGTDTLFRVTGPGDGLGRYRQLKLPLNTMV